MPGCSQSVLHHSFFKHPPWAGGVQGNAPGILHWLTPTADLQWDVVFNSPVPGSRDKQYCCPSFLSGWSPLPEGGTEESSALLWKNKSLHSSVVLSPLSLLVLDSLSVQQSPCHPSKRKKITKVIRCKTNRELLCAVKFLSYLVSRYAWGIAPLTSAEAASWHDSRDCKCVHRLRPHLSKSSTGSLPLRHVREEEQLLFASCSRHKEETPKHPDTDHPRCELSPTISPPGPTVLLRLCVATALVQSVLDAWITHEHPAPAPQEIWVSGSVVRIQNKEPGFLDSLKN